MKARVAAVAAEIQANVANGNWGRAAIANAIQELLDARHYYVTQRGTRMSRRELSDAYEALRDTLDNDKNDETIANAGWRP